MFTVRTPAEDLGGPMMTSPLRRSPKERSTRTVPATRSMSPLRGPIGRLFRRTALPVKCAFELGASAISASSSEWNAAKTRSTSSSVGLRSNPCAVQDASDQFASFQRGIALIDLAERVAAGDQFIELE
jgi:hypothetical protein